jgi:hypothetical protein
VALSGLVLPGRAVDGLQALANIYVLAYFYLALRRVYGVSAGRAVLDVVTVALPYLVVLLLAVSALVLVVVFGGTWAGWLR